MTSMMESPTADQIRFILLGEVRSFVGHEHFTANSFLDLLQILEDGVAEMVRQGRTSREDIAEARTSTLTLLDGLLEERNSQGAQAISEDIVGRARARFCPGFWPFC